MKSRTALLAILLLAPAGGVVWLTQENASLRRELDAASRESPAPRRPAQRAERPEASGSVASSFSGKPEASKRTTPAREPSSPMAAGDLQVLPNDDGTITLTDPVSGSQRLISTAEASLLASNLKAAVAANALRFPNGPSWSPGQAAGAPDTASHGDFPTAWASQAPDAGREWLRVKYAKATEIGEINIHESYNPGAIAKVSAVLPDGGLKVIWEGTESAEEGVIERSLKVPPGVRADQILIELDTARVPGWNEIDAVELIGRDGSRQWAAESTASSHFGQGNPVGEVFYSGFVPAGDAETVNATRRLLEDTRR